MKKIIILSFIMVFLGAGFTFAQEYMEKKPDESKTLGGQMLTIREVGFISGYGTGSLKEPQKDYEPIFGIAHVGFDFEPLLNKFNINLPGILEWYLEPQVNTLISPNAGNVEVGLGFGLEYIYPLTKRIHPYAIVGSGVMYMSQHTIEQSTQFNFHSAAGCGVYFRVKDNIALNLGYRYRHISNASIKEPNSGINTHMCLAGVSLFY